MVNKKVSNRNIFFLLFAVSGFSGLIYESIWSHYLKLFLGHAAYAQTLVLIIYMGGMALGAWLVGKYTPNIRNLLRGYAYTEGIIGLLAVLFHPLFISTMDLTYISLIPHVGSMLTANIIRWGFASLLILPQSVLLGATFPLMSGGVIRRFPAKPGQSLAMLYFTNSLGAAVGVLVSGFLLIDAVGLPGTILTAGIINIVLAAVVYNLSREKHIQQKEVKAPEAVKKEENSILSRRLVFGFMLIAALTGTSSFMYEIGWIRMLSLVLGSSTHAFELMLSAFILGLAIGGYWVSRNIDRLENPIRRLGYIQLAMGVLACVTLLSYGQTFQLMAYAVNNFPKTDQGYFLFNLLSHGTAMLIMIPATICAGMTLPLITYYLINRGYGEGAIGKIYSANTIGSILGVIIGVHFIMPLLGVKNVVAIGGGIDVLLGVALLWYVQKTWSRDSQTVQAVRKVRLHWAIISTVFICIVLLSIFVIQLNPLKMASGVYRSGMAVSDGNILFHQDGKTASIDIIKYTAIDTLSIATNGKSDAAISYSGEPRPDELTMALAAAIPMAFHEHARTAANIGLGSGLTTHVLLSNPNLQVVDTVEIEPAVVEGAKAFGNRVERVYQDPRSHIHIEDAKTFFYNRKEKYDLIVSEPSNPWVSGVAGLFSNEFYSMIRRFIKDDGIFCQWVHLYDMDIPLVASIMKAVSANFQDYIVYFTNDTNIVILAANQKLPSQPADTIFTIPTVKSELAHIGVYNVQDFLVRKVGTREILDPLFQSYHIPANSDYYPVLDTGAARARYLASSAKDLNRLFSIDYPFIPVLEGDIMPARSFYSETPFSFWKAIEAREARAIYQYFIALKNPKFLPTIAMNRQNYEAVQAMFSGNGSFDILQQIIYSTYTYLSKEEMGLIWSVMESSRLYEAQPEELKKVMGLYKALSNRDFHEVLRTAELFLPGGTILSDEKNNFLLKIVLTAHLALGNRDAAKRIWDRFDYGAIENLPIDLRLLGSLLGKIK
jgi:spermidine synthase